MEDRLQLSICFVIILKNYLDTFGQADLHSQFVFCVSQSYFWMCHLQVALKLSFFTMLLHGTCVNYHSSKQEVRPESDEVLLEIKRISTSKQIPNPQNSTSLMNDDTSSPSSISSLARLALVTAVGTRGGLEKCCCLPLFITHTHSYTHGWLMTD